MAVDRERRTGREHTVAWTDAAAAVTAVLGDLEREEVTAL